jgi:hypothetical protein
LMSIKSVDIFETGSYAFYYRLTSCRDVKDGRRCNPLPSVL